MISLLTEEYSSQNLDKYDISFEEFNAYIQLYIYFNIICKEFSISNGNFIVVLIFIHSFILNNIKLFIRKIYYIKIDIIIIWNLSSKCIR